MHRKTKEHLERLAMIIQRAPTGVLLMDREHVVQFANPAWAQMHGFRSASELIGQPLTVFHTDAQMKQEVYPFLETVELIGQHTQRLGRRQRNQGEFSAQTTACLVQDEDDAVTGYILYASNVEPEISPGSADETPARRVLEHCT